MGIFAAAAQGGKAFVKNFRDAAVVEIGLGEVEAPEDVLRAAQSAEEAQVAGGRLFRFTNIDVAVVASQGLVVLGAHRIDVNGLEIADVLQAGLRRLQFCHVECLLRARGAIRGG